MAESSRLTDQGLGARAIMAAVSEFKSRYVGLAVWKVDPERIIAAVRRRICLVLGRLEIQSASGKGYGNVNCIENRRGY